MNVKLMPLLTFVDDTYCDIFPKYYLNSQNAKVIYIRLLFILKAI